jgi:hypothetical protein
MLNRFNSGSLGGGSDAGRLAVGRQESGLSGNTASLWKKLKRFAAGLRRSLAVPGGNGHETGLTFLSGYGSTSRGVRIWQLYFS